MIKRLREMVQARIDAAILPVVERLLAAKGTTLDYGLLADEMASRFTAVDIAGCIAPPDIAQYLDMDEIKDYCAEAIDLDDVAGRFTASDIASELDLSDIASDVEVDAEEVAEHLDYRRLARELLNAVKGGV